LLVLELLFARRLLLRGVAKFGSRNLIGVTVLVVVKPLARDEKTTNAADKAVSVIV
jgi:hypothetical protein